MVLRILMTAAIWAGVGVLFVVAFNLLGFRFDTRSRAWLPDGKSIDQLVPDTRWPRSRRRSEAASPDSPPSA